ncbi:protein of unknown function [Hyphomicrobium sp. MC1]|nr:protein of unknown function [Hyphomicrobium sp. MC1]
MHPCGNRSRISSRQSEATLRNTYKAAGGASHSEPEHALKSARSMLTAMHPRHKWWKKLP